MGLLGWPLCIEEDLLHLKVKPWVFGSMCQDRVHLAGPLVGGAGLLCLGGVEVGGKAKKIRYLRGLWSCLDIHIIRHLGQMLFLSNCLFFVP